MPSISRKVIYITTGLIGAATAAILFMNPMKKDISKQAIEDATFLVNLNAPTAQTELELTQKSQKALTPKKTLTKVSEGLIPLGGKVIDQEAFFYVLQGDAPKPWPKTFTTTRFNYTRTHLLRVTLLKS